MGAEQAFEALTRQLQGADDKTLLKIVGMVDRLAKRGPLDRLLDAHRLRLAVIRPPRPMHLSRLFVLPFEELLVDGAGWSPGYMRVPRDRLRHVIELTFERLDPELVQELDGKVAGRTMEDAATILEVGRELWPAAAEAVGRVLGHGRQTKDPAIRDLLMPLRIAQHLLPVAEAVVTTVWALPPKPMHTLDAAAKGQIAELMGLASATGRDCFQLVAELLVSRSELPLSIIEPVIAGSFELGPRERGQAAAMIAEACQSDMIRLFKSLASLPLETTQPKTIVGSVQAIVSNVESLLDVATKVKFDHRELRRLKADLFDFIEKRLGQALNVMLFQAFESLADSDADIDWRRLERNATATANMRLMAKRVGLASKIDFLFNKAFERYQQVLLAACGPEHCDVLVDPGTMDRLRIIELLFGSRAAMQMLTTLRRCKSDPHEARQVAAAAKRAQNAA